MNLNHILQVLPDELFKQGILLEKSVGVKEIAWGYPAIIKVIAVIKKNNLIILGGDVYINKNGQIDFSYDSWFVTNSVSVDEAASKARKYIINYYNKNGSEYIYSLILKGQSTLLK